jgi:hypothetical protein
LRNAHAPSPPSPRIGTPEHFSWLHGVVAVLLVLNLVDAIFTLIWVGSGLAREANPLLQDLVRQQPLGFAAAKLALVGLGSILLWGLRDRPLAVVAIFGAFIAYYAVLLHHLRFAGVLLGHWLAAWAGL